MPTQIVFEDLEHALMWVSCPPEFEAGAFVSRSTGRICLRGADGPVEEDCPTGLDDANEYIAVPHKNELDLGRPLALRFIDEHAPQVSREVRDIFRRKGAYSRFRSLLLRHRLLEAWHGYEHEATVRALEQWAQQQGFELTRSRPHVPPPPAAPPHA